MIVADAGKGLAIAFIYGVTSASMAFVNKAVLSSYKYNYPIFLVTAQMVFTIVLLESLRIVGLLKIQSFTMDRGRSFILPSTFYAVHCVLSLSALSGMNIPMYSLIKRCSPLVILLMGTCILGKGFPSRPVCASVGMVTLGCIVAGYGDLAFDMMAYTFGIASVFTQSLYLVLVQKSGQNLSAAETLHLNSYNTLPLLLLFWLMSGEIGPSLRDLGMKSGDHGFLFATFTVITMGCLLNFLLFLCTVHNSALTTSLTGSLKSICQTIIGMFTFGGIDLNFFTVTGITLNLTGGVLYTIVKYKDNMKKAKCLEMTTVVEPSKSFTNGHMLNGMGGKNGLKVNGVIKGSDNNV